MDLRFLTKNSYKLDEYRALFKNTSHNIIGDTSNISEIQTEDMKELVTDKAIKAFDKIRHPVFVDHTGLSFKLLGGFPGGLTEIFWNRVGNEGIANLIGKSNNPKVTATTLIAFCDGTSLKIFKGKIEGVVVSEPRGPSGFQWDPVFRPMGSKQTFAEMGPKKNAISMRREAVDIFISHLKSVGKKR